MGKRYSFKQKLKHLAKQCAICGEDKYALLDVHRIRAGEKYDKFNAIPLCVLCHRKAHSGEIEIDRKYESTTGIVLHYFVNGEEIWKTI